MAKKKEQKQENETPNKPKGRAFRRRQQNTSIFFLLWTVFSVFSLIVVIVVSLIQQSLYAQSYKHETAKEINDKGAQIERALTVGPPESFGENNYSDYVRFLSGTYDVDILIFDGNGQLVFPKGLNLKPGSPEYEEYYDHEAEVNVLLQKLAENGQKSVVYEGESEYVYGAEISIYGDSQAYLRVGKSLSLMQATAARMRGRSVLLSIFMLVLTFGVSVGIAGWFIGPITEMTKKARRLAEGDFDVDFYGNDYGEELVELADTLNFARDELSKTDRMQKELIANVSHDFKTPLTMIKGYASMIIEISGDNPEKRNKHAQIIVDEADRLAELVADVLDLSKIQSGIAQLEMTEIDMSAYLGEIMDRFAYLKETQGYQFTVDAEEGLYTTADEVKIGQVLYNLIGNAVNYTGEDKQVFVSLKSEGDTFRFAVRDTGKGIKSEEINGIWDRYYRSTDSHKRPVQGTGLGLSIVKTILQRHGFLYGVESEVGKGSTFYVIFPLAK